jgi:hypothetical protein
MKSKPKPLPSSHEERVFKLGGALLVALEKNRVPRNDENVRGIGWFLICVGESLEKGSLAKAKEIIATNRSVEATSLAVAFCVTGCEIMDWGTGLLLQTKKENK